MGLSGAVASILRSKAVEAGDTFPVPSLEVAVSVWTPVMSATVGVKVQAPVADAFAVPNIVSPSETVTMAWASPVPEITGFVLLVPPVIEAIIGASLTLATEMATDCVAVSDPSDA